MSKLLDAIFQATHDCLWICDREGKVVRISKASEKINGIKEDQVLGKKMEDLVQDGIVDRSVTLEVLKRRSEVTIIQKLKNERQLLVTGTPVFDGHGETFLVIVNGRDITELDRLRQECERNRFLAQEYHSRLAELQYEKDILSEVIIQSKAMGSIFSMTMMVAQVNSTVLIRGESGVGKGLFAKLIHWASKRKDGPFIRVDCGAIPESLVESELFGYARGAFTGARESGKPGHLELAEKGTLFLDEIGEFPLTVQVKILRFLEENEVVRVGNTIAKKIDTRIIASTNRDLERMVEIGGFRKDLFYRLNVVPIEIPPLRERVEDIPSLVSFFVKRCNDKCSTQKTITPRALECLCRYSFPGNIRELANLVEQMVVLTPQDCIDLEDLPIQLRIEGSEMESWHPENCRNLPEAVAKLESEMINHALKLYGSQRKAAGALGIDQATLARKAKRYGI